jgi:hypothetical protein
MTEWKIHKSSVWEIHADGKCMATCSNETDAKILFDTVTEIENRNNPSEKK